MGLPVGRLMDRVASKGAAEEAPGGENPGPDVHHGDADIDCTLEQFESAVAVIR